MFKNIGKKIMILAKVICFLGIGVSVLWGIIYLLSERLYLEHIVIALIIIASGALVSWLSSIFIYGFGELIDKTAEISNKLPESKTAEEPAPAAPKYNPDTEYKCPECGGKFKFGQEKCPGCGKKINWK